MAVEHGRNAPVRGTQSFVGVMAAVFKRPALVGFEVLWRWSFGGALLSLLWWKRAPQILQDWNELSTIAKLALHDAIPLSVDTIWTTRGVLLLLLIGVAWSVLSALGRDVLLRQLDGAFRARRRTLAALTVLRVLSFTSVLALWLVAFAKTYAVAVARPLAEQADPAYVPGFAVVVCMTLLLFVLWSLVSWVFRIAPVLAMARNLSARQSLRAALRIGALRGKLIEINLVMCIVKIALLVLALVFSACPLPFSTVETQEFLTWWWIGVGVLYLLASDYFHVVRTAAYVTLWKAYEANFEDSN